MSLPRQKLLKDCKDREGMEELIALAEKVLRTWQPAWSPFVSALLRENVLKAMEPLGELRWRTEGGHPCAERQRMQCIRTDDWTSISKEEAPIHGIRIEGNFLFDKASPKDIRQALGTLGIASKEIGDIWLRGDRGANAICTPESAIAIDGCMGLVREVKIKCEAIELSKLELPMQRMAKRFSSIEASKRVDAIASAGFGLSRAKIVNQIKEGRLRLNWQPIRQTSRELNIGDRMQLEGKGSIELINLQLTKRQRWKVEMLRQ